MDMGMATYSHYRHVTYAAHPDGTVHTHVRASRNGIWLNQTGDIEDIKINIGTHSGSSYFCAFYVYCIQWRSQGFQSWGVKGRVREGVYPSRWRCTQVSFSAFSIQKINALTPVFMPVDFGKVPNPFDFQRLATEDTRKKQTRSSAKTAE
jgi:hypothetical protein